MKNILLLDADTGLLKNARQALEKRMFSVMTLPGTRNVAEHLRALIPDLIVLDVKLPGGDGRSICQLLKKSAEYREIPVILMSYESIASEELLACEVNEFLLKPFNMAILLGKVERLLFPEKTALSFAI